MKRKIGFIVGLFLCIFTQAAEPKFEGYQKFSPWHRSRINKLAANCNPSTARTNLDINNVRTTILGGGDMFWDLNSARYEIPKLPANSTNPRKHSLYAGAIWVGGIDAGKQLKSSAQTYRSASTLGVAFWPGPLSADGSALAINSECLKYDKHWKLTKQQIDEHKSNTLPGGGLIPGYTPPSVFMDWPAHGDPALNQAFYLAPFVDVDQDGNYNPIQGDYPKIRGDQSIWMVYNDKGNTGGGGATPIGLEIQTEAFAYASNDELNNMTFYQHTLINRSSIRLDSTFMGQWVDTDIGNYADDYVGCDVSRGLGICYNGDNDDEGVLGYGLNPPSIGIDYFEGPFSDAFNGLDDDRDCLVDEIDTFSCDAEAKTERMIMSRFVYYNGDGSVTGEPSQATHAYNYMTGKWKDGVRMIYGGNGYPGSNGATNLAADMMFPGASDMTYGWSLGGNCQRPTPPPASWDEVSAGNTPADRRFIQAGGPFTLKPGAVNYITIGVVWARASSGGATGSFNLLLQADTKAQALFDNCFKTLEGPDAPDVDVVELDQKLTLNLVYKPTSNNYKLRYREVDPGLKGVTRDSVYQFQGFLVYQVTNPSVSTGELEDLSKSRLVYQCDIKDTVSTLVNYVTDPALGIDFPKVMVKGANEGVKLSIDVTKDAFATTSDKVINHKIYYYYVIAYAQNRYAPYDWQTKTGQSRPYFAGRANVKVVSGIPHKTSSEFGGMTLNSGWGDQPSITRLEGIGNGGASLEISDESRDEILLNNFAPSITYKKNAGPVNVRVVDPKKVPTGEMILSMYEGTIGNPAAVTNNSRWYIEYNGQRILSDAAISNPNEQLLQDSSFDANGRFIEFRNLGLSVLVNNQPAPPGAASGANKEFNPVIEGSIDQNGGRWLNFVQDQDLPGSPLNWITSGVSPGDDAGDDNQFWESMLGGRFAPYKYTSRAGFHPAWASTPVSPGNAAKSQNDTRTVGSVDIVLTKDKSKWTRAIVLETGEIDANNEGGQRKGYIRLSQSRDKDGNPDGGAVGMSWFPGYAINLETGERLNICFGENSSDAGNNGNDMKWNPTGNVDPFGGALAGRHFMYIMKTRYDEGAADRTLLVGTDPVNPNPLQVRDFYKNVMWVSIPFANGEVLSTDAKIRLRTGRIYDKFATGTTQVNNSNPRYRINLSSVAATKNDAAVAKSALDTIKVVPNPYYAYSAYENSQIDSRIKVTNLPGKCTIKIYTLGGTLVRTLRKDDATTYVEWDMKNQQRIPVASGTYIIHVDAGDLGTKTL
ncbi:MAG: hypothetical protein RLY64_467, partial [Bacteroidota bacterium]